MNIGESREEGMAKIQWEALPQSTKAHLRRRAIERQVSEKHLLELMMWIRGDPDVPEGEWYKDFGTFKLCGKGPYPGTFLMPGQVARGQRL
jgi:hypothetical protein